MKNNYSIVERNRIVEENLPMIDKVIRHNWALVKAARLDYNDVYQDLAIRLICCVENFDPIGERSTPTFTHSSSKNCWAPRKLTGVADAPTDFRWCNILPLDTLCEDNCAIAVA